MNDSSCYEYVLMALDGSDRNEIMLDMQEQEILSCIEQLSISVLGLALLLLLITLALSTALCCLGCRLRKLNR